MKNAYGRKTLAAACAGKYNSGFRSEPCMAWSFSQGTGIHPKTFFTHCKRKSFATGGQPPYISASPDQP
jgi:hypothetical protein